MHDYTSPEIKIVNVTANNDMAHFTLSSSEGKVPHELYDLVKPYYYTIYRKNDKWKGVIRDHICIQRAYPELQIIHNRILYKIDNKYMNGDILKDLKEGQDVTLNGQSVVYDPDFDQTKEEKKPEVLESSILQKFWEFFGVY